MFNTCDDPIEMLSWLSQRNQHINSDDLAFMLGDEDYLEQPSIMDNNLEDDFQFPPI